MIIKIVKTQQELEHAFAVRNTVFVNEQGVPPDLEIDEHEQDAIHFVGYDEQCVPIAASRLRFINGIGKLERICVLKEHRGKSFGQKMIQKMESYMRANKYTKSMLHSQTHAQKFYEQLGYRVNSQVFIDAGIPHVKMEKELKTVHQV